MSNTLEEKIFTMREISPGVDEYITQKKYIDPTNEAQIITLPEIYINCKKIIIDELEDFGIHCLDKENILTDVFRGSVLLFLKELFEYDKLKEFFFRLNDNEKETIKEIIKTKNDVELDFGLDLFISYMLNFNPNNYKLQQIRYYITDFYVDSKFYDNLYEVYNSLVFYDSETLDFNIAIVNFLKYKREHINKVRTAALYLSNIPSFQVSSFEINSRLAIHDSDLMYGDNLKASVTAWQLNQYPNISKETKEVIEEYEVLHHKSNRHHLEFYVGKEEIITLLDYIEIVSDIYDKQESKEEFLNDVRETIKDINVSETIKSKVINVASLLNLWS